LLKIQDKDCSEDYLVKQLNDLDYEYKKKGINPGTTADLLVASLMIHRIFKSA
jgi:triphosphoribosyl-dephospho-CoA synthetase